MANNEDSKAYHKRYPQVITSEKRGIDDDILDGKQYRTELGKKDESRIERVHDSLRNVGITDSVVYYLSDAVFCEQHNYLWKAYEN